MSDSLLQPLQSLEMPRTIASAPAEQDDLVLVAASRAGNQDAFAQLVQRHQRLVFNLVYRMLQEYEEAIEITQETFLAAWQGLPSFRGTAQFSTWLYRIAYNCALKQIEQRKRDNALQIAVQNRCAVTDSDQEGLIDAQLETRARQSIIREQLAGLPAKYRIVLVLRHLQDMTYEEMARILTVPIGTIKTQLFRARLLLKERLESYETEMHTGI
jgi:RNA polymerase sigma-70 factor, ECF subfamily